MERRRDVRHERNFPLRFGDAASDHTALTRDISIGGLFVSTREVYPLGTRLWLELVTEPQRPLHFEVAVVRQLDRRREGGFGVRFLSPTEVLAPYFAARELPPPAPLRLEVGTPEALALAAMRGLSQGNAFVWSDREHRVGERVLLTIALPFADRSIEVGATVAQVVSDGARFGVALTLEDTARTAAVLAELLEDKS